MNIGIAGCAGRMGRMLLRAVLDSAEATLIGGTEREDHAAVGSDLGVLAGAGPVGLAARGDADAVFAAADVVIDFTTPTLVAGHVRLAVAHGTALIVGTTGLRAADEAALDEGARHVPVVQAANMSIGVNLLLGLTRQVAARLDAGYDIEIVEMHHRHKVDAPSGTALALGRAAAEGRGVVLDAVSDRIRDGLTGPRRSGRIGFATLRGGDVVGEHTVIFAGEGERIELTHRATSRLIFARGAVRAALWTDGRPPGRYGMDDVLGLA
jgi:4-hydroxy-tetrahydrodipicolinate reductase